MDTPRPRPPRPPPPLSKRTAPAPATAPPPPPLSAPTSPSHDFSFSFSSSAASSPFRGLLLPTSMSGTPVGRVGSDLTHHNHARTNHRQTTTSYDTGSKDRDRAKNRASPFFSGLGGGWRKQSSSSDATSKPAEEKRKQDKQVNRGLDVGQWVKKHMAAMVEQLRASFSRQAEIRERRRRPHSFSGHGRPSAARERERWTWRRGQLSSAPASLRVSPANSGHLSVAASVKVSTSSEESTMEELQSAIQAAIAHCKNSNSIAKQTTAAGGETGSYSER